MFLTTPGRADTGAMENGMRVTPRGYAASFAAVMSTLTLSGLIAHAPVAAAPPAGDPVAGKTVSAKCLVCHAFEAGKNKIGPSLAGVVGRKSGSLPGFNYSPAMKASKLTWNAATLDRYLTSPRTFVPGTKMIFAGLPSAADRANLIAYLAQLPGGTPGRK